MKPIRYRAWHAGERQMYVGLCFHSFVTYRDAIIVYFDDDVQLPYRELDYSELTESTGLKDRSGNECFANDILRDPQEGHLWLVAWRDDQASFGLERVGSGLPAYLPAQRISACEIIGNSYEHPQVLAGC